MGNQDGAKGVPQHPLDNGVAFHIHARPRIAPSPIDRFFHSESEHPPAGILPALDPPRPLSPVIELLHCIHHQNAEQKPGQPRGVTAQDIGEPVRVEINAADADEEDEKDR